MRNLKDSNSLFDHLMKSTWLSYKIGMPDAGGITVLHGTPNPLSVEMALRQLCPILLHGKTATLTPTERVIELPAPERYLGLNQILDQISSWVNEGEDLNLNKTKMSILIKFIQITSFVGTSLSTFLVKKSDSSEIKLIFVKERGLVGFEPLITYCKSDSLFEIESMLSIFFVGLLSRNLNAEKATQCYIQGTAGVSVA